MNILPDLQVPFYMSQAFPARAYMTRHDIAKVLTGCFLELNHVFSEALLIAY